MEALRASLEKKAPAARKAAAAEAEAETRKPPKRVPEPPSPRHARLPRSPAPHAEVSPAMHSYGVCDVERPLLHLPRSTIQSTLIEAGFVSPARGPRNAWLASPSRI